MIKNYINYSYALLKLIEHRLKGSRAPIFTALGVTNLCNYKCVYCYGDYFHQKKENFSTEELIEIIDNLKDMGTLILNLIGGEPLIRDDIGLLVNRVKKNGMICTISSNASLLPGKIDQIRNVDTIDTSLDGLEENNDINRGEGTFKKTLEGIKCAVRENIKTNVNMVLTKYNLNDIDAMIKLAIETGFSLSFNIVFESHSRDYVNYQESFNIKNKDDIRIKEALKKIIRYKQRGYPIRFSKAAYQYALNWPRPYSESVYITKQYTAKGFKPIQCYFSQFHCYIDTDGCVYNCMHLKDKVPAINVKDFGVKESWEKTSLNKNPCIACYTICNNDANLIFGLKPSVLWCTMHNLVSRHQI